MADNIFSNYVKFRRGTPEAFASLQHKDSDTLYFIYEEDELTGELYLGSKLISGDGEINGATTLAGLTDVLIDENLDTKDCLIYDVSLRKWINKPIMSVIDNFVGANKTSKGIPGLVPAAPAAGATGLFLRSDGQWAEVISASAASIFQDVLTTGETHLEAINRVIGDSGKTPSAGDIVILRDLISGDNYQHIAHVFDGENWIAMDGSYDAENVYLANNLTITADIGVQKLDGAGFKVLETAGKNLKQVLDMLLASRTLPTYIEPSIEVSFSEENKSYEVGTSITPSFSSTFEDGKYLYDEVEETGVSVSSWSAVFDGQIINSASGTFNPVVLGDGYNKKITVTASYGIGNAPKDNFGNIVTDVNELAQCQIQPGSVSKSSGTLSSFRYMFYGSQSTPIEIVNDNIRALNNRISSKVSFTMNIEEGTNQVIIAIPASYILAKVADNNAFGTNILEKFEESIVSIEGASEGYETDYKVYVYNPDTTLGANTYTLSFQ